MTLFGIFFYLKSHRGYGTQRVSYTDTIRRCEVSDISAMVTITTACFYAIKLCYDFSDNTTVVLYSYPYLDYAITCPFIVLDICFTLDLSHKLINFLLTALALLIACFASQSVIDSERIMLFGLGCLTCSLLFLHLTYCLFIVWKTIDATVRSLLKYALLVFFSSWPLFPISFLIHNHFGILSFNQYYTIDLVLNVLAKGVFGILLTRIRLEIEDIELSYVTQRGMQVKKSNRKHRHDLESQVLQKHMRYVHSQNNTPSEYMLTPQQQTTRYDQQELINNANEALKRIMCNNRSKTYEIRDDILPALYEKQSQYMDTRNHRSTSNLDTYDSNLHMGTSNPAKNDTERLKDIKEQLMVVISKFNEINIEP